MTAVLRKIVIIARLDRIFDDIDKYICVNDYNLKKEEECNEVEQQMTQRYNRQLFKERIEKKIATCYQFSLFINLCKV